MTTARYHGPVFLVSAVAFTVMVWASAFVAIRAALHGFSPVPLAALRYLIASLAIAVVFAVKRPRRISVRNLPRVAIAGVIGITVYNVALNMGERTVNSASASFVGNTVPVFTAALATFALAERLSPFAWGGLFLSLAGAGLIGFGQGSPRFETGVILVLAAALSQAAYFVLQKPLLNLYAPLEFTGVAIWAGTAVLLPVLPVAFRQLWSAPASATLSVIYLGLFPAAGGFLAWAYVLSRVPAARAASFLYFVPGVSAGLGWLLLGERPSWLVLLGGSVSLMGVWLTNRDSSAVAAAGPARQAGSTAPCGLGDHEPREIPRAQEGE